MCEITFGFLLPKGKIIKYNLSNIAEAEKAFEYLTELTGKEVMVDITKMQPRRSLNQNSYLHLLLQAFGSHFGWTTQEAKTLFKREVNPDIFVYQKNGTRFLRSSAELTKEEMMKAVDRFMQYSRDNDYELPAADDLDRVMATQNAIEQVEHYL